MEWEGVGAGLKLDFQLQSKKVIVQAGRYGKMSFHFQVFFLRSLNKLVCLLHENMSVSERLISLELSLELYISVFIYTLSLK